MTDFIYRKENALSPSFCRSLIELFEIDKERQHRGVIRKEGVIIPADEDKISTDISFVPSDLEHEVKENKSDEDRISYSFNITLIDEK